jgi:hypothetical protein
LHAVSPLHYRWLGRPDPAAPPPVRWLWAGYLAAGKLTLLTSLWKSGKTTLTALLLARMKAGGPLAGQDVRPGKALVLSEESDDDWDQRCRLLDLAGHVCLISRPFAAPPSLAHWQRLLDQLAELHTQHAFDLLVIDPLASHLPANCESNAGTMLAALLPLRDSIAACGFACLLLHHPRKKESPAGMRARGSGALSAHADILLELEYLSAPEDPDRRRLLLGCSRQPATPRRRVIELSADGADYLSLGDLEDIDFSRGWQQLALLFADAPAKLTCRDIASTWPADQPSPPRPTLYRWLERAVQQKLIERQGTGRKNDPYIYWLKGQEARWDQESPLWRILESEKLLRDQDDPV